MPHSLHFSHLGACEVKSFKGNDLVVTQTGRQHEFASEKKQNRLHSLHFGHLGTHEVKALQGNDLITP